MLLSALLFLILLIAPFIATMLATGPRYRRTLVLLISATAVRLLCAVVIDLLGLLPVLGGDALFYDKVGSAIAMNWWEAGYDFSWLWRDQAYAPYTYAVATFYYLFGVQPWWAVLVMALLGACSAVGVYLIAADHFGDRVGWRAGLIMTFLPSLVVWTSMVLKEAPNLFAIVLCTGGFLSLKRRIGAGAIVSIAAGCLILFVTRPVFAEVIAAATATAVFSRLMGRWVLLMPQRVAKVVKIYSIIALITVVYVVLQTSLKDTINQSLKDSEQKRLLMSTTAKTSYLAEAKNETIEDVILFIPIGSLYFLMSPFPWEVGTKISVLYLFDLAPWYVIVLCSTIGVFRLVRDRDRRQCLGHLMYLYLPLIVLFAMYSGNSGTAMRHRSQVMPLFVIAAAVGITAPGKPTRGSSLVVTTAVQGGPPLTGHAQSVGDESRCDRREPRPQSNAALKDLSSL